MSKQFQPASTASVIGPCPTIIKIVGRPALEVYPEPPHHPTTHNCVRIRAKLVHIGSKTRALGQILEKPYVHSRGHSFDSKFKKLYQNVNDHNI